MDEESEKIENLNFTGYITDNELVALYKKCKGFIFPSLYEGFGLPPLEALTIGCKNVLLSDIPVFKEIYENTVSYVNTNREILKMNGLMKQCEGNVLKKLLDKYSWKGIATTIIENLGGRNAN